MSRIFWGVTFLAAFVVAIADPNYPQELAIDQAWWALPLQVVAGLIALAILLYAVLSQRSEK